VLIAGHYKQRAKCELGRLERRLNDRERDQSFWLHGLRGFVNEEGSPVEFYLRRLSSIWMDVGAQAIFGGIEVEIRQS
jgi:hypothetical protein